MSCSARRLGILLAAAAALAGCMSGRSSLLATRGAAGDFATDAPSGLSSSSVIGPSRALAISGNAGARDGVTGQSSAFSKSTSSAAVSRATTVRAAALTGPGTVTTGLRVSSGLVSAGVSSNLVAPAPSSGSLKVATGVNAHAGPVSTSTQVGVAITPTLAPASAVGASVAAVSQPLNVAASAQAGGRKGAKSPVKVAVKIKAPAIGANVRVGR